METEGFEYESDASGRPIFTGSEYLAAKLVEKAWEVPEVYDLCALLARSSFDAKAYIHEPFAGFISEVLGGRARPKRRGTPPQPKWPEREMLWSLAKQVEQNFGLLLTRNDESKEASACDAVAEALTWCGRETAYSEIKNLFVHPDFAGFRQQVTEMAAARRHRAHIDEIMQKLFP
jgi:hypothetical protein